MIVDIMYGISILSYLINKILFRLFKIYRYNILNYNRVKKNLYNYRVFFF